MCIHRVRHAERTLDIDGKIGSYMKLVYLFWHTLRVCKSHIADTASNSVPLFLSLALSGFTHSKTIRQTKILILDYETQMNVEVDSRNPGSLITYDTFLCASPPQHSTS